MTWTGCSSRGIIKYISMTIPKATPMAAPHNITSSNRTLNQNMTTGSRGGLNMFSTRFHTYPTLFTVPLETRYKLS